MSQQLSLLLDIDLPNSDQAERLSQALLRELRNTDLVEQVGLQPEPSQDGAKGVNDWLKATFSGKNLQNVFKFISERLPSNTGITLKLKVTDTSKEVELTTQNIEEFVAAAKQIKKLLD